MRLPYLSHFFGQMVSHSDEWLSKILVDWGRDVFGANAYVILESVNKAVEIAPVNRAERKREGKAKD